METIINFRTFILIVFIYIHHDMLKIAIVTIFYVHCSMHLLLQIFKINISFSYFLFYFKVSN
jgi:hypothetical protein